MNKLSPISESEFESRVCKFNKDLLDSFISVSTELSAKSRKSYKSNLRVWFYYVATHLNNKRHVDIKPLDVKKFFNWMASRGCTSSDQTNKKSAISSLNIFIETYLVDDPEFKNFRNFINKSIKMPPKVYRFKKEPLTIAETEHLIKTLKEQGELQKVAYAMVSLSTGARRAEVRQLRRSILDSQPIIKTTEDGRQVKYYITHEVRAKGRGEVGKIRKLTFDEETYKAIEDWLKTRDDDCPYIFVHKVKGEICNVGETTFNTWTEEFAKIVGRRFTPHGFRSSISTQLVVERGKSVKAVQALLGHESSVTTEQHYIIRPDVDRIDEIYEV